MAKNIGVFGPASPIGDDSDSIRLRSSALHKLKKNRIFDMKILHGAEFGSGQCGLPLGSVAGDTEDQLVRQSCEMHGLQFARLNTRLVQHYETHNRSFGHAGLI